MGETQSGEAPRLVRLVISLKKENSFFFLKETTSRTSRGFGFAYSTKLLYTNYT